MINEAKDHKHATCPTSPKLTTLPTMESNRRSSTPATPPNDSPAVQRMTLSETLALPPPSPPPPPPHSHLWEEMGMPAQSPPAAPSPEKAETDAADSAAGERRSRVVLGILRRTKREAMVRKAKVGLRVCGMVFCLVSFSVMVADKTQGWAGDSFDRYIEYRYHNNGFFLTGILVRLQTNSIPSQCSIATFDASMVLPILMLLGFCYWSVHVNVKSLLLG